MNRAEELNRHAGEYRNRLRADLVSGRAIPGRVPDAVANERLAFCAECPSGVGGQDICLECGCSYAIRRWLPWWFCRLGNFGTYDAASS